MGVNSLRTEERTEVREIGPIQHEGELKGNAIRARLHAVEGIGQRTYTPTQIVVEKADGVYLYTVDGKRLIDFSSGVLVTNLGHGHRRFQERYDHYLNQLPLNSYNMVTQVEVEASERLVKTMAMNPKAQKVLWAASGSEAIQKAMWCALHRYRERPILVATRHGFHGKKGLAADVTGETSANPNVRFISFPMYEQKPESFYQRELDALAGEFPNRIALLITEPYLGAAGSFHPPKWYHRLLQRWCKAHEIPLIFDEIQSCFGRTSNMYAFETYEAAPDLVVLGKGVANGVPGAAVVGRADLIDSLGYGEASDTYSGNPQTAAAVCATLDVFEEEDILGHCRTIAPLLNDKLHQLKQTFSFVRYVRGEGLVYGIEMADAETANACVLEAYRGAENVAPNCGVHFMGPLAGMVLRVSPPLTITEPELELAFQILRCAWARLANQG